MSHTSAGYTNDSDHLLVVAIVRAYSGAQNAYHDAEDWDEDEWGPINQACAEASREITAAEAERDRLRAALEPLVEFVDAVTAIDAHYASGHPNMTPEMAQAWPGVCERAQAARAALAGQTAGGGGGEKNGGE